MRAMTGPERPGQKPSPSSSEAYWALGPTVLFAQLGSGPEGLSSSEAARRLETFGPNLLRERARYSRLGVLFSQLKNPLLLLLVAAAIISAFTGEWIDALIVFTILVASVGISTSREYRAQTAVAALQARIRTRTTAIRDGIPVSVPVEEIVPGDVVILSAGSLVPGDGIVLEASDCFVSEAVLTGESFPVVKSAGTSPASAAIRDRSNAIFFGSNVRSGTAKCLVVRTGPSTEFGAVAARLAQRPPETDFDRGIRRFGYLLTSAMLVLVVLVFFAHVLRGRPAVETLLFSVALAVGLSPELLPAILSVNLARGAQVMARHGVLVRRLNAIENLGSMDVLCTDKTGTLTKGVVELEGAYDVAGQRSAEVLRLGALNAALETGIESPLDAAILAQEKPDAAGIRKLAEIPFDFVRRRVSVVVQSENGAELVTKGAFPAVLEVCTTTATGAPLDAAGRAALQARSDQWASAGIRILAVASRTLPIQASFGREDESGLSFAGWLTFLDRPKEDAARTIADLATLGVSVKVITGDSKLVTQHVASLVGMKPDRVLTGGAIQELSEEALWRVSSDTDLFVEVDPNQKERIIRALRKTGHVVGFLGDGVNDAPAMHAADTSLSVEEAVDVAREAADFVLLERDLDVIREGIQEGRRTFANTLKYVLMTTSANLGNMVSMAAASLFLSFLPLLPGQILLNNFLSSVPAVGLADDRVDPELVERPGRWDIRLIGRFMVQFGVLSSGFDMMTFGVLLFLFHASHDLFRTSWFVESLLTQLVIALVVRTRRPFFRSRPSPLLLRLSVILIALTFLIPFLPFVRVLGFVPMPPALLAVVCMITMVYVVATEGLKHWFFRSRPVTAVRTLGT